MNPTRRTVLTASVLTGGLGITPARAGPEDDVRSLFERFVAAQNAHDAAAVEATLWESPNLLWITRGTPVWGRAAAMERFRALYQGTWNLAPDMAQFRVAMLGETAAQAFVPIMFMIGPAGQPAQPTRFLMNQTLLRVGGDWRIASILPIPAPAA
jgi:hypothetical protein